MGFFFSSEPCKEENVWQKHLSIYPFHEERHLKQVDRNETGEIAAAFLLIQLNHLDDLTYFCGFETYFSYIWLRQ